MNQTWWNMCGVLHNCTQHKRTWIRREKLGIYGVLSLLNICSVTFISGSFEEGTLKLL
uniref:Uncharacterized protein n=1 Tax=Octopus bimaculoides TaxID=37653 RepID=A0A0L8IE06_OCTBM